MSVTRVILLDDWNFDFAEDDVRKAFLMFDRGVLPTRVAKNMGLTMREVMVMMLDWSDKRGKWN